MSEERRAAIGADMNNKKPEILSTFNDVSPYLNDVVAAADTEKNALGFFAGSVFHGYARSEQLYVAVVSGASGREYAGHLLFDCRPPRAKVLQIFCSPAFRGNGVARSLVDFLKKELSENGIITIYARVADDLKESNAFWADQGFYVQQIVSGGKSKNRTILIRAHELAVPQLFDSSGISNDNPLGVDIHFEDEVPIFLLDLNVLFDLGPRRPRNAEAIDLFRSERMGSCRLAVSTELEKELKRTATSGRVDPMQAYARIFDNFDFRESPEGDELLTSLSRIVFAERAATGKLSENDRSDLRHLATAVQNGLSGLITNDDAVLGAAARIKRIYGLHVFSPAIFKEVNQGYTAAEAYNIGHSIELRLAAALPDAKDSIREFLVRMHISQSAVSSGWVANEYNSDVARFCAWANDELIGYMVIFRRMGDRSIVVRIAVDEANIAAARASQALIRNLLERVASIGASKIKLEIPQHQATIREAAYASGFFGSSESTTLVKVMLGTALGVDNWSERVATVASTSSLQLPDQPPMYKTFGQLIPIRTPAGHGTYLSLEQLEDLLSPAILCLPGRNAVITPVKRSFSEPLLGHSLQGDLLPKKQASLYQERHYLSDAKNIAVFAPGTIILFYESLKEKGRGAIVAIARTKRAYLKSVEVLGSEDFDASVLDENGIARIGKSKMKTITVFDNVICFPQPVPLASIQKIGCGRPVDLLTSRPISAAQLQNIISEGFPSEQ